MHPISNSNFGNAIGKMAVRFHNGTAVGDGYIVKQLGKQTFLVGGFEGAVGDSAGAAMTKVCKLAQTSGEVAALTDGLMTIPCVKYVDGAGGDVATNVSSIMDKKIVTVAGEVLTYKRGTAATAVGQATVGVLAAAVTNVNDA